MKIKIRYFNEKTGRSGSFVESLPDYIDASDTAEVSDYIRNVHLSDEKILQYWTPVSKSTKQQSSQESDSDKAFEVASEYVMGAECPKRYTVEETDRGDIVVTDKSTGAIHRFDKDEFEETRRY